MTLEEIKELMDECEEQIRHFNLEYLERLKDRVAFIAPEWNAAETPQQNAARYGRWKQRHYEQCDPDWALAQRCQWEMQLAEIKGIYKSEDERTWQ